MVGAAQRISSGAESVPAMMDMMSGMGWGMGIVSVILIALLVLALAALIKYVFFR